MRVPGDLESGALQALAHFVKYRIACNKKSRFIGSGISWE